MFVILHHNLKNGEITNLFVLYFAEFLKSTPSSAE